MESFGITCDLLAHGAEAPGAQIINRMERASPDRYAAIVGIGGDGTHSSVMNALMEYRAARPGIVWPPYAMLPMGTGNSIAKSFGLDSRDDYFADDLRRAVATIRYGADYQMDLGRLGQTWFANSLTIGLDSSILREHNRQKQAMSGLPVLRSIIRGNLLYTYCAGARFWRQRLMQAEIAVDGRPWYSGPLINLVINNTRVYAGVFVLCPDAFANDGLLEVVAIAGHTDYLAKYLLSFRSHPRQIQTMPGRFKRESAIAQGKRIEVRLSKPETAQCDGEEMPARDHFAVEVYPNALRIKIPVEPA
jgi:diacylglycerol kinase family enzyme